MSRYDSGGNTWISQVKYIDKKMLNDQEETIKTLKSDLMTLKSISEVPEYMAINYSFLELDKTEYKRPEPRKKT